MCNPYLSNTTMKTAIVQLLYYERIIEISVQIHNSVLLLKLQDKGCFVLAPLFLSLNVCWAKLSITVWKVYLFRIFLVRNFPHLDWIRTRKTPNTDIFYAVYELFKFWCQFKKELIYPKSQIDTNLFAESNFVKTQNTAEVWNLLLYEIFHNNIIAEHIHKTHSVTSKNWYYLKEYQSFSLFSAITEITEIPKFHRSCWFGNFVNRHSLRSNSGLFTKFPHQEIRWNFGILRSVLQYISWFVVKNKKGSKVSYIRGKKRFYYY